MWSRRAFLGNAAAAAITLQATSCRNASQAPLRAGYVKVLAALPFMFAHRYGLFRDSGLTIDAVEFGNSNDVATAGVTGSVDFIGAGATNACLDAMTAARKTMQIFTMNNYVRRPNHQSSDFLLSLPDYTTIQSLRGQPIAFFPGSFGRMFARLILPRYGLEVADIQYVEMQPAQWFAALRTGAVKAVTALEPVASKIMSSMPVNVLIDGYYASVMQGVPGSGSWFAQGHLERSVEQRVHDAMISAVRILTADRSRAVHAIQELFSIEPAVATQVRMLEWRSATDPIGRALLQRFGSLLASSGGIARSLPTNDSWIWA